MSDIYCTSYCNKGHRLKDGKPVQHECYIIPPRALEAERKGSVKEALDIMSLQWPLTSHRGTRK